MKNKRISFFLPSLGGYGCERVVVNLIKGFCARGLDVELVVLGRENKFSSADKFLEEMPVGVKVNMLTDKDAQSFSIWQKFWAITNYLKQTQPEVLMTFYDTANIAALSRLMAGVKTQIVVNVVVELSKELGIEKRVNGQIESHRSWVERMISQPKEIAADLAKLTKLSRPHLIYLLKGRVKSILLPITYPQADLIITASRGVAKDVAELTRLPESKIQAIWNPISTEDILTKAEENVNHPWFVAKELPIILGVGRLEYQKDFFTLINAFAIVRQSLKSRLVIFGEGRARGELEQLVSKLGLEDEVSLPGYIKNPYPYMKNADVFVLSSYYEGFGYVIVESLAVGTPVVSTDCPSGPDEVLEHGKYGRLVDIQDANGLASAILATLSEPPDPQLLQKRARDFHLESIVEQYLNTLNKLGNIKSE